MIKRILIGLLFSSIAVADHNVFHKSGNVMVMAIVEVIDGDTVRSSISLPVPLNKISIRVAEIDTPESTWRAKCEKEKILGLEAKKFLKEYMKPYRLMILKNFKYGTYAGRIISEIWVNDVSIGELMISKGYAKYYDGRTKSDWCFEK